MSKTTRSRSGAARAFAGLLTAIALAACATGDIPTTPLRQVGDVANNIDNTGFIRACKVAGPSGSYAFETTVVGGGAHLVNFGLGSTYPFEFTGTMHCINTYLQLNDPSWLLTPTGDVTIKELVPDGIDVAKIEVWDFSVFPEVLLQTITGTNSVTIPVTATTIRKVYFYNADEPPPPPPGGEGCTPGYWKAKSHLDSWAGTAYTTGQTVGSVFANSALYGLNGYTLLQGLSFQGGSTVAQAAEILLRASIAAVLNASHPDVDYAMSAADIVSDVNAALASGDRATILNLAVTLDFENNRGCTID
jgi:hypothetical protein